MFYTIQDPSGRSVGRIEILDVHTNELLKDVPLQLAGIFLNKNLMGYLLTPLPAVPMGDQNAAEDQSSSQTG